MGVRAWTVAELGEEFGPSARWWKEHCRRAIEAGVLAKQGKVFFGDPRAIAGWLTRAQRVA